MNLNQFSKNEKFISKHVIFLIKVTSIIPQIIILSNQRF